MNIRRAGKFYFWVVQHWGSNGSSSQYAWHEVGGSHFVKLPENLRWAGKGNDRKELEPFQEWSACGECWQTTGNHGFMKGSDAMKLFELLTAYTHDTDFRAAQVCLEMTYGAIVAKIGAPT